MSLLIAQGKNIFPPREKTADLTGKELGYKEDRKGNVGSPQKPLALNSTPDSAPSLEVFKNHSYVPDMALAISLHAHPLGQEP